jgi:hypothetical protein
MICLKGGNENSRKGCHFSLTFACHDSIEPIKYGVCYIYMGCRDEFVADGSFVF